MSDKGAAQFERFWRDKIADELDELAKAAEDQRLKCSPMLPRWHFYSGAESAMRHAAGVVRRGE